jgi:uncharacterized protein YdeI (YjbR/CyaY-like superfamily)
MNVPYAKKWHKETGRLRAIALQCGLTEECKWGKPCFTFQKKNVAIIIPLKASCAFSFVQGALLRDPHRLLANIGRAQAGRWIKFTSVDEIVARQADLREFIVAAVALVKSGKRVVMKKPSDYAVPEELQAVLDANPEVRAAFNALTPGRRKSYLFHVGDAKLAQTRTARAAKCVPLILSGRGFLESQR